jgi:hypothetical protein
MYKSDIFAEKEALLMKRIHDVPKENDQTPAERPKPRPKRSPDGLR